MNSKGNTSANRKENPEKLQAWQTDGTLKYRAASSDERALVAASAKCGFHFQAEENDIYHVRMAAIAAGPFYAGMILRINSAWLHRERIEQTRMQITRVGAKRKKLCLLLL